MIEKLSTGSLLMECTYHIALSLDKRYLEHLPVVLTSFSRNNAHILDTTCFHILFGEDASFEQSLTEVLDTFVNIHWKTYSLKPERFSDFSVPRENASHANYFRIFLPEILNPSIDKVLYLDLDLVILDDIAPVFETDVSEAPFAVVTEIYSSTRSSTQESHFVNRENNQKHKLIFNSGVMLMNCEYWREHNLTQETVEYTLENSRHLVSHSDQAILNTLFSRTWKHMDPAYNVGIDTFELLDAQPNPLGYSRRKSQKLLLHPRIFHFHGKEKPWNKRLIRYGQLYYKYHPNKKLSLSHRILYFGYHLAFILLVRFGFLRKIYYSD